jgi:N-acetyltransferase 10
LQYLKPHDHGKLSQVELLVIDEAAAIPLPIVKSMLGPYLVFLSSTVNGYVCFLFLIMWLLQFMRVNRWSFCFFGSWSYEGTGRSLSLKLLQQLECQSQPSAQSNASKSSKSCQVFRFDKLCFEETSMYLVVWLLFVLFCFVLFWCVGRLFKKIELNESIRYASGDPIETWLNDLLCLDLANSIPNISRWAPSSYSFLFIQVSIVVNEKLCFFGIRLPHPKECDLYYVNRDTLFSYHKESEIFLQVHIGSILFLHSCFVCLEQAHG